MTTATATSGPDVNAAAVAAPVTGAFSLARAVPWVRVAALLVPFFVLFWPWFEVQAKQSWWNKEDWGHAFLVPLISVFLVWQRRAEIGRLFERGLVEPFWPGLVAVLMGVASYGLFTLNDAVRVHMLQGFAIVLTVFGMVLTLGGPRLMRWSFIPVSYLAFGITVSESIMLGITFALQAIAAEGSWVLLSIIGAVAGFQVELIGNTLEIITAEDVFPLGVAEACSGMRMVIAFYALAAAVAFVSCRMWWQRIATILLAGPVAIVMNVVRVTVLGLLTLIDPDLAAGDAHMVIGTILLVPSLLAFLGVVWALNRVVQEPETAVAGGPNAAAKVAAPGGTRRVRRRASSKAGSTGRAVSEGTGEGTDGGQESRTCSGESGGDS